MFKNNPNQGQISILDPGLQFPKYVLEALAKTWAPYFYENIFKNIEEERFAVLFSENYSRPNAPVNIIAGLLFLKELNGWTDEEMIGALYFDYRVQYALGITDFEKERICINTVGNFRGRLYEYSLTHGVDILAQEVHALTEVLIEVTGMDTSKARQDSFMISACPAGFAPQSSVYDEEKQTYTAKFAKEHCNQCPLFDHCPVKEQKRSNRISFTSKTRQADICRARMGEAHFQELAAFRAGVEEECLRCSDERTGSTTPRSEA